VHESLNFAVVKQLPVIFVCENNLYSVYSPLSVRQPAHRSISQLAAGHGITTLQADGNDVDAVHDISKTALEQICSGKGPVFLELPTYRWREHCGPHYDNDIGYRSEEEFLEWKKRDPIERMKSRWPTEELDKAYNEINQEIDTALAFAKSSPFPQASSASDFVYA
jgi:pyruvate dehydrogenase E1 component alpha subunit